MLAGARQVSGVPQAMGGESGRGNWERAIRRYLGVAGTQWAFGSVGNGRWAGVRFRDVLAKAGLKDSATEILLDGADVPLGKMPDFQRTIPVNRALDPDTLLAYEMNGEALPVEHGFPLRLIVPGWAGDSWVKWLQHIEVLDHEFDGFWMKSASEPSIPVETWSKIRSQRTMFSKRCVAPVFRGSSSRRRAQSTASRASFRPPKIVHSLSRLHCTGRQSLRRKASSVLTPADSG